MSDASKPADYQALLKKAYSALGEMETRLESLEQSTREPIAIIGLGCRFPGDANNSDDFWKLLLEGIDAVSEIPPDRWDVDEYYDPDPDAPGKYYSRLGTFLKDIDLFDSNFFRISPREASSMDPKQRLLLEVAWEALEDAGLISKAIAGSRTGVFVGMSNHDYLYLQSKINDPAIFDAYSSTGVSHSVASGRLSYFLNLHGPNVAMDTACSSSLVATHLACQSLRLRECDMAMAGGVNLMLIPEGAISVSRARMVSFDGRCKTFDASADGYGRGEGCGMVVLKRLSDALENDDRILAVILGTAMNQDGRSNGLTAPSGLAQEAVIKDALKNAGVKPGEVSYIEAHGTGTSLGDPIEVRALDAVFGESHTSDQPLYVGSVKTNIGHLEGAAGIAGLIKLVLSLENKVIPPHLHFHDPNPLIQWDQTPVRIPTGPVEWSPRNGNRRIGGLSSFGYSGTNVHMILAEAPPRPVKVSQVERPHHILTLSGKNENALKELATRYHQHLSDKPKMPLRDVCFTANSGRYHFGERLALIAENGDQAREKLAGWLSGEDIQGVFRGTKPGEVAPQVVFMFTGQGAQYTGMGRDLYETQPAFRKALDQCNDILSPYLDRPLLSVMYPGNDQDAALLDQTAYTQPALFAIEYALARLWSQWGIEPGVVLGHSVGEYVAACIAGVFDLESGLKLIAARGRLMQDLPAGGAMAAIFTDEEQVAQAVKPYSDKVSIAGVNGPANIVISGSGPEVQAIIDQLETEAIKSKRLVVSHAFHSPLMDPILDAFREVASSITYSEPQIKLISNISGDLVGSETLSNPDYWRSHVREPVRFYSSMNTLGQQGYQLFLEIGPQPTLLGMGSRCLPEGQSVWLPSLRQGRDDWVQMLESLGGLYTAGLDVDWDGFDRDYHRNKVVLPTYPFQRQQFLINRTANAPGRKEKGPHPLIDRRVRSPLINSSLFEADLSAHWPEYLTDHRFFGAPLFPATAHLEMALAAGIEFHGPDLHTLEEVSIQEALILPEDETLIVQAAITPLDGETDTFQIYSLNENSGEKWKLHTTGKIRKKQAGAEQPSLASLEEIRGRCTQEMPVSEYYQQINELGAEYGPTFQGITELWRTDGQALGRIELPETIRIRAGSHKVHPALLDAGFQIMGAAFPEANDPSADKNVYVPVGMESYQVYQVGHSKAWAHVILAGKFDGEQAQAFRADVTLYAENGSLVARLAGLQLRKASRADIWKEVQKRYDEWLYEVDWLPKQIEPAAQSEENRGTWLVFADNDGLGARLVEKMSAAGLNSVLVHPGAQFQALANGEWQVDPDSPQDFKQLLEEVLTGKDQAYQGTVYLWGLDAVEEPSLASLQGALQRNNRGLLHLVQALISRNDAQPIDQEARLWVVTRSAQPVGDGKLALAQAPLWGMAYAVNAERPDLRCSCLDLDPGEDSVDTVFHEITHSDGEDRIAWRGQERYVARLAPIKGNANSLDALTSQPFELDIAERGILDNLVLRPAVRQRPGPGEVEIRIKASGLNFRDVLNALGMYPGPAGPIGTECAGVVLSVGEGVTDFSEGDEVIALGKGAFKSHLVTSANLVFPIPAYLSLNQAASIPIAFLTAYYGLHNLAKIKPGDRVLIHAAAGGVGFAAVQLAQRAGAMVYGTAGSPAKHAFLHSTGVQHVMSSRSLDFADEIMELTNGEGVDIVLNALADEFISRSLSVLADHGRFLEIGKRGIWDKNQVAEFNPTLEYYAYDLTQVLLEDPLFAKSTMAELMAEFEAGQLAQLPLHTFPITEIVESFRFMAQARHIGKIVITQEADSQEEDGGLFKEEASYLLTGGLGGLGLAIADEMVRQGARHLVLMGRSAPSKVALEWMSGWKEIGAEIVVTPGDVSIVEDVAKVMDLINQNMPPLRGVIHAAGVLDDGALAGQSWPRFETVLKPKMDGAWNLHTRTLGENLDFFVLFSSIASVLGSPGQSNYAAANAFLDVLAHYRRSLGLSGMSINWGPWSEVGMAAGQSRRDHQRWGASGVINIAPDEGKQVFARVLRKSKVQISVYPMNWSKLSRQMGAGEIQPLVRDLINQSVEAVQSEAYTSDSNFLQSLESADPEERSELLMTHIEAQVLKVLGLDPSQSIDPQRGLADLGMDSLMTVELSNRMKASLGKSLPTTIAFEYPTIAALAGYLLDEVLEFSNGHGPTPEPDRAQDAPEEERVGLVHMTEDEVEDILLQELEDIGY
jgi:acyl transferase domain-containing protein/acyl carrier protein